MDEEQLKKAGAEYDRSQRMERLMWHQREGKDIQYYVHSLCCMAHWELTVEKNGEMALRCELCGKLAGIDVKKKGEEHARKED